MRWGRHGSGPRRLRRVGRPGTEPLEGRQLLATLTVDTTADDDTRDGALSLREAIEVVNGTLDVGALSAGEQAQISGALSSPNTIAFGIPGAGLQTIALTSGLPTVTAPLVIDGFTQPGSSPNVLARADDAQVQIEVTAAAGFAGIPLRITAGGCVVQGLAVDDFPSLPALIVLDGPGATGDVIRGDFLGVSPSGAAARGFAQAGVVLVNGASNDTIGGTTPDARNVIAAGSAGAGAVAVMGGSGNVVAGNFLGVDVTGDASLNGAGPGVEVGAGATGTVVGGTDPGAGNVISANAVGGVVISGAGTAVEGNLIGTGADGTTALGNVGDGVAVLPGATDTTVGGLAAGAGNTIAFNQRNGVSVAGPSGPTPAATGTAVLGNAIFGNTGLGIALADDTGAAALALADPVFSGGQSVAGLSAVGGVTVSGTLNGLPNTDYRVEFFGNPAADPSGFGQGEVYLGALTVTTGADGTSGPFRFQGAAGPGARVISATATDTATNTTSGFARDAPQAGADLSVSVLASTPASTIGGAVSFAFRVTNNGPGAATDVSVSDTLPAGLTGANASASLGSFSLSGGSFTDTIVSLPAGSSVTVTISGIASAVGALTDTLGVTAAADPNTGNNTATASIPVSAAATSTVLSASPNPSDPGQPVTFTAVVSSPSGTPTGAVMLIIDGRPQPPADLATVGELDEATFTTSALPSGRHTVTATYGGDPDFAPSQSAPLTQAVNGPAGRTPTTLTIMSSGDPESVGQGLEFTVVVHAPAGAVGGPTGAVTFTVDGVPFPPAPLISGEAEFAPFGLPAGVHTITATYGGDGAFAPSSVGKSETINPSPTATALTATPAAVIAGQPVTFAITVVPVVTPVITLTSVHARLDSRLPPIAGTVTLMDGPTVLATLPVDANGHTQFTTASLAPGAHAITATFRGGNYNASTSNPVTETVNPAPTLPDGPQVTAVQRYGFHAMPTTVVLTFTEPLDPSTALDPGNYRIVGPRGWAVHIGPVAYDPSAAAVVLHPVARLNLHRTYRLTVNGSQPGAVTDASGRPLDGARTGRPGSDFVTTLNAGNLIKTQRLPQRTQRPQRKK